MGCGGWGLGVRLPAIWLMSDVFELAAVCDSEIWQFTAEHWTIDLVEFEDGALAVMSYSSIVSRRTLGRKSKKLFQVDGTTGTIVEDEVYMTTEAQRLNGGREYPFSEGNILAAVQALKDIVDDGLLRTNEKSYDLLCLGRSMQQSIEGDTRSFQLDYIDWEHPDNNVYHVTEEFVVERSGSHETRQPDIVLFVNGVPLVVIECKRPDMKDPIGQAISQHIRNQQQDQIPRLFFYAQLLFAVSKNEARYATVGTVPKFWSAWKEDFRESDATDLKEKVRLPLSESQIDRILASGESWARDKANYGSLERQVTPQDRALYALCRRERLLELIFRFMLFDAGEKKIARHQQYFCVNKILDRVRKIRSRWNTAGRRRLAYAGKWQEPDHGDARRSSCP